MRRELVRDDSCLALIASRAPMGYAEFKEGDSGWRIVRSDGVTTAAAAFSGWQPHFGTVEFSGIALHSQALSTRIVVQLGAYAYGQLCCSRVWARTLVKNHRAINLLRHIGFTAEGTHADFYGVGMHAQTFRLLRREWDAKYGRPLEQIAA